MQFEIIKTCDNGMKNDNAFFVTDRELDFAAIEEWIGEELTEEERKALTEAYQELSGGVDENEEFEAIRITA